MFSWFVKLIFDNFFGVFTCKSKCWCKLYIHLKNHYHRKNYLVLNYSLKLQILIVRNNPKFFWEFFWNPNHEWNLIHFVWLSKRKWHWLGDDVWFRFGKTQGTFKFIYASKFVLYSLVCNKVWGKFHIL